MGLQTARNILSVLDGRPIRENVINTEVLDSEPSQSSTRGLQTQAFGRQP